MRRTVIIPVVLHALVAVATLLWLLWYFIPTGNVFKGLATLLILFLAGWTVFKNCRSEEHTSDVTLPAAELPLLDTQGPVVLVCGDMLEALFQGGPLRKTAQGWWLRAGDVSRLTDVVRSIQKQFPRQVGQLSVMYRCLPDEHQDEAVLRSTLKTLRQQCKQIKSLTGFTLPVVVNTPLIDGTEVAIAYSNGDIDLPYIAYALHDLEHPDLVNRDNHTRNVLRTPANSKLRMEDKRGEEHIKLATEYGKTQLNSGHLVDNQGKSRGTGSELRTDEYGVIRAGKGLFISADAQAKAQGEALDMDAALKEIDRLNQQLQQLEIAAENAQALKADVDSQIQIFEQRLKPLNEAVHFTAPEGMALTSGEDMQLAAARNVVVNAGGDISVGTMGNLTTLAGEKLGLFARIGQLSVKSGEGPIDIQAQNASLRLFAEKKLTLSSASDISFAGKKRITLIGGGSYLRLEAGKVEYGTTASYLRKVKRTMFAGATNLPIESLKQMVMITQYYDRKLNFSSNVNYRVETMEGEEILSGSGADGYIDKKDSESEYWVFLS